MAAVAARPAPRTASGLPSVERPKSFESRVDSIVGLPQYYKDGLVVADRDLCKLEAIPPKAAISKGDMHELIALTLEIEALLEKMSNLKEAMGSGPPTDVGERLVLGYGECAEIAQEMLVRIKTLSGRYHSWLRGKVEPDARPAFDALYEYAFPDQNK